MHSFSIFNFHPYNWEIEIKISFFGEILPGQPLIRDWHKASSPLLRMIEYFIAVFIDSPIFYIFNIYDLMCLAIDDLKNRATP